MSKTLRLAALAAGLLLVSTAASAGDSKIAYDSIDDLFNTIFAGIESWKAGNAVLNSLGQKIAVTLFGLIFMWGIIKSWVTGKGMAQLVGDLVQPLVLLGVTLYAINGNFGQAIADSTGSLASAFANGSAPPASTTARTLMNKFAEAGITIVFNPLQDKASTAQQQTDTSSSDSGSWSNFSVSAIGSAIVEKLGGMAATAYSYLVRIIAMVALMLCGAIGAGMIILAQLMIALGIVLAPVMIPWGMWTPTAFLFTGWLKFMITAGMQVVVTFAMGSLLTGVATSMAARVATESGQLGSFGLSAGLLLFSVLCIYLMLKVDAVAVGLVQGDGSTGLRQWSAAAVGAAKSGAAAAKSAASAPGTAVNAGAAGLAHARNAGAGAERGTNAGSLREAMQAQRFGADGKPAEAATRTERVAAGASYAATAGIGAMGSIGAKASDALAEAKTRIEAMRASRASGGGTGP